MRPANSHRLVLIAGSAGVAAVLAHAIWLWRDAAQYGWTGLRLELQISSGASEQHTRAALLVKDVEPLSPSARAGLSFRDSIVAVNGTEDTLSERFRRLRAGEAARLRVAGDAPREVVLRSEAPLRSGTVLLRITISAILGFASFLIGAFVLYRRTGDARALILFVCTSLFAIAQLVNTGPVHTYPLYLGSSFVPVMLYTAASLIFFPSLLHFCLVFPRRRPALEQYPRLTQWIYGLPGVLALFVAGIISLAALGQESGPESVGNAVRRVQQIGSNLSGAEPALVVTALLALAACWKMLLRGWMHDVHDLGARRAWLGCPGRSAAIALAVPVTLSAALRLGALLLPQMSGLATAAMLTLVAGVALLGAGAMASTLAFPVAACVAFWRSYRSAGYEEKRQLRWPLWGIFLAVAGGTLTRPALAAIAAVMQFSPDSTARLMVHQFGEHLPHISLILIPLTIAFAVLKYRLMDIDIYVRRTAIYGAATGFLGLLYLAVVGTLGALITRAVSVPGDAVPIGSTLVVAVLFIPVRNRVQALVDRRLFRRMDYPGALRLLAERSARAHDERELLADAAGTIHEALHARTAAIWLGRATGGVFRLEAAVGVADESELSLHAGDALAGVVKAGPPPWPGLRPQNAARLHAARTAVLAPLRTDGTVVGFLGAGSKLSDVQYSDQDLEFLEIAAGQIAVVLRSLQVREEQRETERARQIQEALLPKRLPEIPGYLLAGKWNPARSVGGDYYDVIEIDPHRFALVIADVAGKGIGAALLMSNLQSATKLLASEVREPAAVCSRANRIICENTAPGKYITFFYAVLDTTENMLTYCNAGHNAPVLHRPDGGTERLDTGGVVLGFFPDASYEQAGVKLRSGDRLVLFTDGLSEANSDDGEEFGEDRIAQFVAANELRSAADIMDGLISEATEFSNGGFHDDVTLLVLAAVWRADTAELRPSAAGASA